jgi:ethanolamine transporter EutH
MGAALLCSKVTCHSERALRLHGVSSAGASPAAPHHCENACAHAGWFLLGMRGMVALTCSLNRVVAHSLHAVECMLGAAPAALLATIGWLATQLYGHLGVVGPRAA